MIITWPRMTICRLDLPEDESNRFTLILMNILMSEFSGIEASVGLLNMQDNPPRNPLINLMSADKTTTASS
jgi:hypothetical protein